MTTKRNAIAEANEEAANRLLAFHTDREAFDMGWDSALEFARPLIQAYFRTLQVLEDTGMLEEAGKLTMLAAERFLELVPEKSQP